MEAGETAYLDYLGIHSGGVRVSGPGGTVLVTEGDNWAHPSGGQPVMDPRGRRIERYREGGSVRYLIFGTADYAPGEERPLVWVAGDAIERSNDLALLARIDAAQRDMPSCARRFVYGWDLVSAETGPDTQGD